MSRELVIFGAGGHGCSVLDAALSRPDLNTVTGLLDEDTRLHGTSVLGVEVVGGFAAAEVARARGVRAAIVAIGDNRSRAAIAAKLLGMGFELLPIFHARARVSAHARIAEGVVVLSGAVVNAASVLGRNAIINSNATIEHHCEIGESAHVASGAVLGGAATIGEGALVGLGARVLPGISLGDWSTAGAGAVVTRDVPAGATVVGIPAAEINS